MDIEMSFNHFRELGMPTSISLKDFRRMYQLNNGKLGSVIEDIKEKLLGRQETASARLRIQQLRDSQRNPRSKIRAPVAGARELQIPKLLDDPKEDSTRKQETAERVLHATKLEWHVESERHHKLDQKVRQLKAQLRQKQERLLLLLIVERREGIRLQRFGTCDGDDDYQGVGDMLNDLRAETSLSVSALKALLRTTDRKQNAIGVNIPITSLSRSRATVETLTHLSAYHTRIQKALMLPPPELSALELQLRSLVYRCHEKSMPEQSLDKDMNQLMGIAKARAEGKYKFRPISETPIKCLDKLQLQCAKNQEKQQEIEAILREIIRLKLQSEKYHDIISSFREEVSSSLREMLHEEQTRISGYIDRVKDHVLKHESDNESEAFEFEARRLLASSRNHLWQDLQSDLIRLHESQGLLQRNANPHTQMDLPHRIDEARKNVEQTGHKLEVLLERKGRKADYGFQLVDEIKNIGNAHKRMK